MKILHLFCFFIGILLIQEVKSQNYCFGIDIPFNVSGYNCGETGIINLYFNPSSYEIDAGVYNISKYNLDYDLCFLVVGLNMITSGGACQDYDAPQDYGEFFINVTLCNTAVNFFQIGPIQYNSSMGLYIDSGTCVDENSLCYSSTSATPTSTTLNFTAPSASQPTTNATFLITSISSTSPTPASTTLNFTAPSASQLTTNATFPSTSISSTSTMPRGSTMNPKAFFRTRAFNQQFTSSSSKYKSKVEKYLPPSRFSIDDFCANTSITPIPSMLPAQGVYCSDYIVEYLAFGDYCQISGTIELYYNSSEQILYSAFLNVTEQNISQPICFAFDNLNAISNSSCPAYDTDASGIFSLNVFPCDSPATIFQSIGPIYYNDSGLSYFGGTCNNGNLSCSSERKLSLFPTILPKNKMSKHFKYIALPLNLVSINDYCNNDTSTTTLSPTVFVSTTSTPTTPSPIFSNTGSITPPQPLFNCTEDNSYIIDQTCAINGTINSTHIAQIINETASTIHELIKNDSFTSADVHDTGIFLYHTVTTVDYLTSDSAHKFLDLTSTVSVQPLEKLADANEITPNSLLWYPSSIPKVVAKTDQNLNYSKEGGNLLVNSFTLDPSFCADSGKSHEICYSKKSQVPSGSDDAEFCTTFNPTLLCNNSSKKAYVTMWKSLSFFALVKNNSMGIKTGLETTQTTTPDQPVTFDTADRCSDGTYLKNNYGSNVGGVDNNGQSASTASSVWSKRRDDENDLHISKYRIAKFTETTFEDAGTTVTKNTKHYTAQCPDGTCTLIADGNPTEPTICNQTTKNSQTIVIGIGIALAAIAVVCLIFQSDYFSVISRVLQIFFSVFNDKNLPKRVKFFAYCYNITFLLYSIYLIFIAQQEDSTDKMCTAFAIVGYVLYISAIFLSIIMLIITIEVLGCWKPPIRNSLYIFTGNQKYVVPFIHSYGIPLLITGGFAYAFSSFFKRNDGYCWIRPDYAFPALWIPLILLLLTIPLYIILIARRWSDVGFFKMIYGPLTIPEEIALFEELRRKKEDQEKEDDIEDFKKKILGKSYQSNGNAKAEEKAEDEKIILTSRTIARLMIPQIFLAIPLIAENLALYYAHVTGWHYLFLLTQGLQAIVLNGMDWLEDLPEKFEDFKDRLNAIRGSPKEVVPDETRWGTENTTNLKNNNGFTRM